MATPFAVGRRYRCTREEGRRDQCHQVFDFVIVGPAKYYSPKTNKRCRLEVVDHGTPFLNGKASEAEDGKCGPGCYHGVEQDYSHKHLKKYGVLVEE